MADIKVTGERNFGTGAKRDPNNNKGRYDLISPWFMERLAKHTQRGAQIRGERNWENGMPIKHTLDSAIRHIYKYIANRLMGCQQDEDHLAAAAWNIMNAIHHDSLLAMGVPYQETLDDFLGDLKFHYSSVHEPVYEHGCHDCRNSVDGSPDISSTTDNVCRFCQRLAYWEEK